MNRRILYSLFLTLLTNVAAFADLPSLEKRVIEHRLANGIKLLVLERHFSPTVSIRMMFRTGSVDEVSGKTGLAHMFEHMMFKGTHTLGTKNYAAEAPLLKEIDLLHRQIDTEKLKGAQADQAKIADLLERVRAIEAKAQAFVIENELWNLYEREGASNLNASTSRDLTQYVLDIPSNKFELWAIVDSDRVRNPVFRQFYQEREVVKEERRMRVDTSADGKLYEHFFAAAYMAHPYRFPTIGWESDLDHLSAKDLEEFYAQHYTPDQLTIAIVGDVEAKTAIALVEKHFGDWRTPPAVTRFPTQEPVQNGQRRVIVRYDAQPQVGVGYHLPVPSGPEQAVSYAISYLLGNGTTSRLYKSLVEKKKVASGVETAQDYPGERYAPMMILAAATRHPRTPDDILEIIDEELTRLKREPIADWELEKIRASVDISLLNTLQTNAGMAQSLAYNQSIFGDWRHLLKFQSAIKSMTAQDIQKMAQTIFVDDNKTVVILEPQKK